MREDATPRKTNTSPENQLEDVFAIEIVPFLGDMLVLGVYSNFEGWRYCNLQAVARPNHGLLSAADMS